MEPLPTQIGQTVERRPLAKLPPPVGGGRCRLKNGAYFCCGLSPGFAGLFLGWVLGAVAIFRYSRLQRSTPCRSYHKHRAEREFCKGRFLLTVSHLVRYAEISREIHTTQFPDSVRACCSVVADDGMVRVRSDEINQAFPWTTAYVG